MHKRTPKLSESERALNEAKWNWKNRILELKNARNKENLTRKAHYDEGYQKRQKDMRDYEKKQPLNEDFFSQHIVAPLLGQSDFLT